jgi:bifunctional non-homologous end joining protein LigD
MAWYGGSHPQGFIDPCIPTLATKPPVGPQWFHEIKHDGYRLIVCRRAGRVRVFTRRGYDWTERYPLIRQAMLALPRDATIDGEAVVRDAAGLSSSSTAGSTTAARGLPTSGAGGPDRRAQSISIGPMSSRSGPEYEPSCTSRLY